MLPGEFPQRGTVQYYFYKWRDDGTWHEANRALLARTREAEGRAAGATACVIDSQSVKTTESGGPRGFDAGKKVMGRNRHILVDTGGRLLGAAVHEADIQDRDGAPSLLAEVGAWFPEVSHIFADGAYAGPKLAEALKKIGDWAVEIVKRVRCARAAGWLNAPSHGSGAAAVLRRMRPSRALSRGSWSPIQLFIRRLASAMKINDSFPPGLVPSPGRGPVC